MQAPIWRLLAAIAIGSLSRWNGVEAIGEGVVDLNTLLGVFGGIGNIFTNFNTSDVDTDRIMGKWYQMYKAAINFDVFQTNMYCHVAYFSRNKVMGPQGFSMEEAYHVIGKAGPIESYKRDVTRTGNGEYWMYTEEYFYPRQFYILKVGPDQPLDKSSTAASDDLTNGGNSTDDGNSTLTDWFVNRLKHKKPDNAATAASKAPYEYLIATDANRLALMVYARDPIKFYETYDKELLKDLQKGGFGGYVFWNQPVAIYQGADCYYPTEKEVFARRALKAGGQRQAAFAPNSLTGLGSGQQQPTDPQFGTGLNPSQAQLSQQAQLNPTLQSPALSALLQQQQQLLLQQQAAPAPQQAQSAPGGLTGGLLPPVQLQQLFG